MDNEKYIELVEAMGMDPAIVKHQDVIAVAKMLLKVKTAMIHAKPEKSGGYFITGEAGEKDVSGLPERIFICPTMGLAGFAVYSKTKDYSEPEY